jgi:hypothetical protein
MRAVALLTIVVIAGGCEQKSSGEPSTSPKETSRGHHGIWPKEWTCDKIATVDQIGQLLGGAARTVETGMGVPDGVPKPCNYAIDVAGVVQAWTFDLDCRNNYKRTADALFAQYTQTSADRVEQFNQMADAGGYMPAPYDGAPPSKAPEGSRDVQVGSRGLDHHGQGLLFVDDDAPCYVRVVGPDADRRLALAQHIAQHLSPANAPMDPRAAP